MFIFMILRNSRRWNVMSKKVLIVIRLIPEASKVANENLKAEIKKELSKSIFLIPWADFLESIQIKD